MESPPAGNVRGLLGFSHQRMEVQNLKDALKGHQGCHYVNSNVTQSGERAIQLSEKRNRAQAAFPA